MLITLLGYMGSGKSIVGEQLSKYLDYNFIDLDNEISLQNNISIKEIFSKKGEIYFRKEEHRILIELLQRKKSVISLGGGTAAYYNNIHLINKYSFSIYLKANAKTLTERIFDEKDNRPIISHLAQKNQLEEFINIHLFERSYFYQKAKFIVEVDTKSVENIVSEIIAHLAQS